MDLFLVASEILLTAVAVGSEMYEHKYLKPLALG